MKNISIITLFLLTATFCFAQSKTQKIIQATLNQQAIDWNKGDIPAFMEAYWKSDQLQFIGSKKVTYGWQNTLDNYLKSYPDQATMGQLTFNILEIKELSRKAASVTGKWMLNREEKEDVGGHFLLIWRKIKGKWVIVADCTN